MCGDIFELAFVETYRLVSHSGRVLSIYAFIGVLSDD